MHLIVGLGNLFITRHVDDPSRWGIVENGIFKEKPKQSTSHEASMSMVFLDKKVGEKLEEAAIVRCLPPALAMSRTMWSTILILPKGTSVLWGNPFA